MAWSPTSCPSSSKAPFWSRFLRSSATCRSPASNDGVGAKRGRESAKPIDEDAEDEDRDAAPQQKGENGLRPGRIRHYPRKIGCPQHSHRVAHPAAWRSTLAAARRRCRTKT